MADVIFPIGKVGLVTDAVVYELNGAVIASKYPMATDILRTNSEITKGIDALAKKPSQSGEDNFLSGILVAFDLTCSNKMWIEFERYHHAQIVSSQSTMHRLSSFDLDHAYNSYVDPFIKERMKELQQAYNADKSNKENYLRLLYSNPAGMRLTARVVTNYRQLKTMYRQRYNHRLPEWREFCQWMAECLPHSEWITAGIDSKNGKAV